MDPLATAGALVLNEAFVFQETFEAHTRDVNELQYTEFGGPPDIVINTACEHMEDDAWFHNIPDGTIVALQSNDMKHDDHVSNLKSKDELAEMYGLTSVWMSGTLPFKYKTWSFNRFMIIGVK
jgi:hypothetical protein